MHRVEIYADGACSGNPGPSGIGVVLKSGKHYKEISKAIGHATNNRAEIQAAIEGLRSLNHPEETDVVLYTDSQLVEGFLAKDWEAKVNRELVLELLEQAEKCRSMEVVKVKAHDGYPENEQSDHLAKSAVAHQKRCDSE